MATRGCLRGCERRRQSAHAHLPHRAPVEPSARRRVGGAQFAAQLQREIDEIDAILDDLVLGDQNGRCSFPAISAFLPMWTALVSLWQQRIRPILDGLARAGASTDNHGISFDPVVGDFVSRINSTVLKMEVSYGKSIDVLRNLQILLIVLAVIGTIVCSVFFNLVIRPVSTAWRWPAPDQRRRLQDPRAGAYPGRTGRAGGRFQHHGWAPRRPLRPSRNALLTRRARSPQEQGTGNSVRGWCLPARANRCRFLVPRLSRPRASRAGGKRRLSAPARRKRGESLHYRRFRTRHRFPRSRGAVALRRVSVRRGDRPQSGAGRQYRAEQPKLTLDTCRLAGFQRLPQRRSASAISP